MAETKTDNRAMVARNEAISKLIENHKGEWETLLGDARERKGLPRDRGGLTAEQKQTRIAKHIAALKKLGVEVPTTTD